MTLRRGHGTVVKHWPSTSEIGGSDPGFMWVSW